MNNTFPDVVRIEPVGLCNFRCIHCPTGISPNKRKVLAKDQFHQIMDQFLAMNSIPRVVVLYHGGEPLLNKHTPEYVEYLKSIGVNKVHMVTNGSLLTEETSIKLIKAGLDEIHISFDGRSPNENNEIRKKGDFDTNSQNLKKFYSAYKSEGTKKIKILISNVVFVHDKKEITNLKIPEYLIEAFSSECPEIEYNSVPAMIWPGFKETDQYRIIKLPIANPDYCGSLFETITIMSNGEVVPCCYDLSGEVVFGNVFEENILNIWNNDKFTEFRDSFRRKEYPDLCSKCHIVTPRYISKVKV